MVNVFSAVLSTNHALVSLWMFTFLPSLGMVIDVLWIAFASIDSVTIELNASYVMDFVKSSNMA